jgi:hypothetical protein
MKRLPAIWILSLVLAFGSGFTIPSVRMERGAEIQVLLCVSEQHCEQQFFTPKPPNFWEEISTPITSHYDAPQNDKFIWPSVYQRPPTPISLAQI